jgi:HEAT repeat protein
MRHALFLLIAVLVPASVPAQERLSRAQTEQAAYALHEWLEAEHYDPAELSAVTKYGESVVPSLTAALDKGPSPARRERLRRALEAEHGTLSGSRVPAKADFVKHYTSNFETLYRIRAAQALAAIGGPEARTAIEVAVGKAGREDLRAALQLVLKDVK